jgi:aryl-alcohol dehydrogenase-like predicted oxidoreductase
MGFREIEVRSLGRKLSNVMAHPASASGYAQAQGLEKYAQMGGNCIHLHGEGGEVDSRRATGDWLEDRGVRGEFFVGTQICHTGWDEDSERAVDRFTPEAVQEDIGQDLELLRTKYLDFVYLDDSPGADFEAVIKAIGAEVANGRVRAYGVRNWTAERLRAVVEFAAREGLPTIGAVVTTELAPVVASEPLWPEYVAFDEGLRSAVVELGLGVLAHAEDFSLGMLLFEDDGAKAQMGSRWARRWGAVENAEVVKHVKEIAEGRGLTAREASVGWLMNQEFPVVGIVGLPALLRHPVEYEQGSKLEMAEAELGAIRRARQMMGGSGREFGL